MSGPVSVAAVDLGASSGRVMAGRVGPGELGLAELHRFANVPVRLTGTLHWDILSLLAGVLAGLRVAGGGLASLGIDAWGVDYGLLDADGALLGNPVHYRDSRTETATDLLLSRVPAADLYAVTGIQQLPINTICQLTAAAGTAQLAAARTLLMIPDLLAYWLTGVAGAEVTCASTTQLLDVRAQAWATALMTRAGIPPGIFPPLRQPGTLIGGLLPAVAAEAGLAGTGLAGDLPVLAVGSHDTASAVAAVPAGGDRFAYISCGTWSLVGMELPAPVLTEASRLANFTNETGIDGTIRYLRNVMGLWLVQESTRAWSARGLELDLDDLLGQAARVPAFAAVVDPDDPGFLAPGDMPGRIAAACQRTGQPPPPDPAAVVRCILDSLALAYRRTVADAQELSGRQVDAVHIVGGGARNSLLCQLTADACGLPVIAGPVEAAALGNVLVQARALGAGPDDLAGMRRLLRQTQRLRQYRPSGDGRAWAAAARRIPTGR
ncbi:MAG TPA: rhamnulokinase family protein [Streptosporangiaceae bacterium]